MTVKYRYYIGGDPGGTGAAAIFNSDGRLVEIIRFNTLSRREVLEAFVLFRKLSTGEILTAIEDVSSMPRDYKPQLFTFGKNEATLMCGFYLLSTKDPMPIYSKTWQREFRLGAPYPTTADRKRAHQKVAQELFPEIRVTLDTADALLIGLYLVRYHKGELTHGRIKGAERRGEGILWETLQSVPKLRKT